MKLLALKVYFFLATTCPISQQYTAYIQQFTQHANEKNIEVVLVFPAKNSSKKEVQSFLHQYQLSAPMRIDKHFKLAKQLNATVTPEVFLMNEKDEVLYHGAIDNWYYSLGQNRVHITEHYLDDAVTQAINNQTVLRPFVKPVGCFIETGKPTP
jgi:hypothetical protein